MNHNFKKTLPFVRLTLLSNGRDTYISILDIRQILEDTSGEGKEGVGIWYKDDTCTFVKGPLDAVMYAIDEAVNPDWYKEACDEECKAWDDLLSEDEEVFETPLKRDMKKLTLSESCNMIQSFIARKTQCDGCVKEKKCNENFEGCVYFAAYKKIEEALRKAGEI